MQLFSMDDFKVFDIDGFNERMAAILLKIRPKLASIGNELAPELSSLVDEPLYVHVAKHARRTVNPPDDTWAAIGPNPRGYKKDVHFKVAVSRNCVRLLFEAGPEYYAKQEWARAWQREFKDFADGLASTRNLAWFKDEHDEAPASCLMDLTTAELKKLAEKLTGRRDGQLVLGRRIDAAEFVRLKPKQVKTIAADTFTPLAPLFRIQDYRVVSPR